MGNNVNLRIDGWFVQPSLNLLTRGNEQVRLRAQLMDLLVCLANRPGQVFRKEELVAEVWDGRWIATSGLSRCMSELRAALGDDARESRVIETITKRGYRLIAPVEVCPVPPAASAPSGPDVPESPASQSEEPFVRAFPFWQRLRRCAPVWG